MNKIKSFLPQITVAVVFFGLAGLALAAGGGQPYDWQAPTSTTPPDCSSSDLGCYQPLNVSAVSQQKTGGIDMGGFISRWHGVYHGDVRFNNWLPSPYQGAFSVNEPDSTPPPNGNGGLKRRLTIWVRDCANSPYYTCPTGTAKEGSIGVANYCDQWGQNCFKASDISANPAIKIIKQSYDTHARSAALTVTCPSGYVVSGGGFEDVVSPLFGEVNSSYPTSDGKSWVCEEPSQGDGFSCYAICISGTAEFIDQGDRTDDGR